MIDYPQLRKYIGIVMLYWLAILLSHRYIPFELFMTMMGYKRVQGVMYGEFYVYESDLNIYTEPPVPASE